MEIAFAIPGFPVDRTSAEGRMVRKVIATCADRVGSVSFRPGLAVFRIDRAFSSRASKGENAAALETLLAALCALNRIWLTYHPHAPGLYDTPVFYRRTDVWDTIPALYRRSFGDCKSLSACVVAQLRHRGIWCRPAFRFQGDPSATMFHILIMLDSSELAVSNVRSVLNMTILFDGAGVAWGDPSADLGMLAMQELPGY